MFENYPYIDKNVFPALEDQYIFFQTEELKKKLCRDYLPYKIDSIGDDYHRSLGGLLLYPPCCVEYFLSEERKQQNKGAFLLYYGMTCAVAMRDLEKAAVYLWDLIPNKDDDTMVFKDGQTYIEIPYRDLELIRRLQLLSAAS
jgi:hypothetical protein